MCFRSSQTQMKSSVDVGNLLSSMVKYILKVLMSCHCSIITCAKEVMLYPAFTVFTYLVVCYFNEILMKFSGHLGNYTRKWIQFWRWSISPSGSRNFWKNSLSFGDRAIPFGGSALSDCFSSCCFFIVLFPQTHPQTITILLKTSSCNISKSSRV